MMDAVNNVIVQISDVVWNYLLLFTGGYGDLFSRSVPVSFRSGVLRRPGCVCSAVFP